MHFWLRYGYDGIQYRMKALVKLHLEQSERFFLYQNLIQTPIVAHPLPRDHDLNKFLYKQQVFCRFSVCFLGFLGFSSENPMFNFEPLFQPPYCSR